MSFEALCVFLLAATSYFNNWYLIWAVALAALLPWGWPAWRIIAWTGGAMAGRGFFIFVEAWWKPGREVIESTGVSLMFTPPLLLIVAAWAHRSVRRRGSTAEATRVD
jgi:hypothetical protein